MNKFILIFVSLVGTSTAFAAFVHLNGSKFIDDGITINYPCSGGGEPLVIYSTPIHNLTPISSKNIIYPLYIKPGYAADPLTIGENTESTRSSNNELIIENPNPAYDNNYVRFHLQRANNNLFYVNTINFASIDVASKDRYVSTVKVMTDDDVFFQSITPVRMYSFNQDWGVYVFKNLHSITGYQYAWNQKGSWSDKDFMDVRYPVKYFFKAEPEEDLPTAYNGFGFWVCGSDQEPQVKVQQTKEPYFFDKINKK